MSKKRIYTIGEPLLRQVSHPVKKFDLRLSMILRDMAQTMYEANGLGLAAPQLGLMRRIVVIDEGEGLREFINPEFISKEGEIAMEEGCLSVPGRRGCVTRAEKVVVRAQDRHGKFFDTQADGMLARALQHEIDHLNGVLYVDLMDYEIFEEDEAEDDEPPEGEKPTDKKADGVSA